MLSIGKLTTGAEDYYLHTVAEGREEYYTGAGEAPGVWVGQGTHRLGLTDTVDPDQLRAVLAGRHPHQDTDLTAGRIDRNGRVAGFDCTFSAPKSVSVLWAMTGRSDHNTTPHADIDPATAIRQAHDQAVKEAVHYLETHALAARRGNAGQDRIETTGMVAAAFRHRTSRNGDPQLHTHVLVSNVCEGKDGRWSAPDARLIYYHGRTAGFVYQASLRAHLAESLGLEFEAVSRGVGEVKGIPAPLLRAFSTRRAEIESNLERHGATSARAAEIAALDSRRPKDSPGDDDGSLHDRWRDEAREHGFDPSGLELQEGRPRSHSIDGDLGGELAASLLSPTGLTERVSVFERRDVVRAIAERMPDGAHLADIERLTKAVLKETDAISLGGNAPGGEGRWTTAEMLATEERLVRSASVRRRRGMGIAHSHFHSPDLSPDQRRMVQHLTTSGNGVDVVVGKAGAGKTTALAVACRSWESAGYNVTGTALSARAAEGLRSGAGIPSVTLARLLASPVPSGVLVVDEAGMIGTRDLARLVNRAELSQTKVVLIGDPRQLPEISAGGSFTSLASSLGAVELTDNHRQAESWERATLDQLRHGSVSRALETYETFGRVHTASTSAEARQSLVDDWLGARRSGTELRMLAPTRREADELNTLARARLRERGNLGSIVAEVGGLDFALGDTVVCLRNDRHLGIVNGTRGTIIGQGAGGGVTLVADDNLRYLPAAYLADGYLTHGYATTIHKSQGETVDRAFVLGGASLFRESGYVAMSRARDRTDIYVTDGAFEDGRGPDAELPLSELTRALETSRAKHMAHDATAEEQVERHRLPPFEVPGFGR